MVFKKLRKSVIYIFLMSFFILFVSADCESNSSDSVRQNDFGLENSFVSGTKGLSFDFIENMPPSEVFDNQRGGFLISFLVKNEGEHDVEKDEAKIAISGFSKEDLNLDETYTSLNKIIGTKLKEGEIIEGREIRSTSFNAKYMKEVPVNNYPLTIYANICYPYETKSFTVACIKGDTITTELDESNIICDIDNEQLTFVNSAAPVSIENVKQYAIGEHSIQLIFDIVHRKLSTTSALYAEGSFDNYCEVSDEVKFEKENKVKYTVSHSITNSISCDEGGNSNEVFLQKTSADGLDHKTTVICELDTENQDFYPLPVEITLNYEYRDRISKQISIKKSNN